ncbi:MAG: hypothetical protein NTX61_04485 [Bacteroidetes bacterium]|nr:hypothetical protein [Bacteroidota bacterium]
MKRIPFQLLLCTMLLTVLFSCGDENSGSECGEQKDFVGDVYVNFFYNTSDIYWGISGGVRSYTYNWECGNICTKQNPQVWFTLGLNHSNSGLSNPFTINAGVYTCLGVQPQHATLIPNLGQDIYKSDPIEIGMNQCFSGQSSATIHPYMTLSFTTLGTSQADSAYMVHVLTQLMVEITYYAPK